MSGWKDIELGSIASFSYGTMPNNEKIGIGMYPTFSGYKYQHAYPEYNCEMGDLIVVARGVGGTGDVKIVKERCYLTNLSIKIDADKSKLNNRFLYYFYAIENLSYLDSGSAQSQITIADLAKAIISVPPLPEQKYIAAVLSSLDDKIDLLHRQNQTIEALAETLFRQWFVVDANEGWEVRRLSSIANFLNGLACQKYPPKNDLEKLPVLKIRELGGGMSESSDWATSEVKPEYIVEAGDVIFAWSASLMVKVWDGERCVLNQHLFKVTSTEFPKWFYLMWCKHHLAEFISISSSHATTMGHIKRGDLDAAMVSVPSLNELKTMSEQMMPLLDKQIAIAKQIKSLEKLRDTLLPKLMSGEVRVS